MGDSKPAKRIIDRPKFFIDARGKELRDVTFTKGHYAIRIGDFAFLLSSKAAEAMAWAVLQRQAKRQVRERL